MNSNDNKRNNNDSDLSRKKFLNRVAMATALVGVTGIAAQHIGSVKKASAMMKAPVKFTPIKTNTSFVSSTGFKRPVSGGTSIYKPSSMTSGNSYKPNTGIGSTVKPGGTASVNKPNTGTSNLTGTGIKPGNTSSLINKFQGGGTSSGGGITAPTKPNTGSSVTAPTKPNTGSNVTAPTKPNTGSSVTAPTKPNTNTSSTTGTGIKPGNTANLTNKFENNGTGTSNKPGTGGNNGSSLKPNAGTSGGSSQNKTDAPVKPGNTANLTSKFENNGTGTSNKPGTGGNNGSTLKPNASTSGGTSQNKTDAPVKPGNTANLTNKFENNGTGTSNKPGTGGTNGSSQLKPNTGSSQNKPNSSTNQSGSSVNSQKQPVITQTNSGGKPSNGTTTGNKGSGSTAGSQNGSVKPNTSGVKASSLKTQGDESVNTNRISNTGNVQQNGSSGGRFNKIMTAVGLLSTVAFLGTSIAGIIQGEQSMQMQVKLQQDAIKAQEELAKKQQNQEYEKLAAQLGGKYDPENGVIILPDGSKLNVFTGIVVHPDGSWTDQNGILHLPDGSGAIKPDGSIDINGVGSIDKDGNLVLEDGSGYFDKDGNFVPSGSIAQVVGVATASGYGGMYTDTKFGGKSVISQSENYGYKAYSKEEYNRAKEKAETHKSVADGVFTAREYDAVVNLILSSKINKSMLENMEQDGTFTSEQIEVISQLLDTFNSSGKI